MSGEHEVSLRIRTSKPELVALKYAPRGKTAITNGSSILLEEVTIEVVAPPIPSQEVPPSFPRSNARCQTIGCPGRLAQVDHNQDEQRYYRIYRCPVCKQYASPRESWVPVDEKPTRAPRKKIRD